MARPTKSRALYMQMIGRGTRLFDGKSDLLVIDFRGNAGVHELVTPLKLLAGAPLDDEQAACAEELIESEDIDVIAAAAQAILDVEALREKRRAEARAPVVYQVVDVDPFLGIAAILGFTEKTVLAIKGEPGAPRDPATPSQLALLARRGVDLRNITRHGAAIILDKLELRRRHGLCTFKQARALFRKGVDASHMTFEEAGQHLDAYFGGRAA